MQQTHRRLALIIIGATTGYALLRFLNLAPLARPNRRTSGAIQTKHLWCERRDSNPHALRRWNLNPVRLPIPPHSLTTDFTVIRLATLNAARFFPESSSKVFDFTHIIVRRRELARQPSFSTFTKRLPAPCQLTITKISLLPRGCYRKNYGIPLRLFMHLPDPPMISPMKVTACPLSGLLFSTATVVS